MSYDLNLGEHFADFDELQSTGHAGFCIAQRRQGAPQLPAAPVPLYGRVDVQYSNKLDANAVSRLRRTHSLVCISAVSMACMPTAIKLQPDIVQFAPEELPRTKKALAGMLNTSGIYVEMCTRDALYGRRVAWMNGMRRLLRLGCARRLVLSSGAGGFTELRSADDMLRILALFGLRRAAAQRIVDNSEQLLRQAALRRYSADGAIAHSVEDGRFKADFIINYRRVPRGPAAQDSGPGHP